MIRVKVSIQIFNDNYESKKYSAEITTPFDGTYHELSDIATNLFETLVDNIGEEVRQFLSNSCEEEVEG